MKKISFIEAGSTGFQMLSLFRMARIGTVLLSTILKERGYEVKAFIEDIAQPDWSFIESSELVCISTLTPTSVHAYEIATRIHKLGIPVIMGGVHPTFLPEEALQYADFVVRGEGEYTLPELLGSIETGLPLLKDIKGLSYQEKDGTIIHNPMRPYLEEQELNDLPIPDFSLVHQWKASNIYPVCTSRGCPFDCSFCSVVPMFGRKYRFKSIESVLEELRYVRTVSKAILFFVDDNFTANKTRTKELLRRMISEKMTFTWGTQVRADVATDPELLKLMKDAGCITLYIGFESINQKTLENYNKKQNVEDISLCIREVKSHGFHLHGMFILGADTDGLDTLKRTVDFAIKSGIDSTQIIALTPLPGTHLFEEMKRQDRILHTDWSKYNLEHVVFRPAQMTPYTLQTEFLKGMGRFFSWRYIFRSVVKMDMKHIAVGLYGKRMVRQTIKELKPYIESLQNEEAFIENHIDQRQ